MKLHGSIQAWAVRSSRLGGEAKLSFAAGLACCGVGGIGLLVNFVRPGSTTLPALAVIGIFYLVAGAASAFNSDKPKTRPATDRTRTTPTYSSTT